ncbi:patatin-like phospholipase family protein [Achromobacter spanius]|uniref:patatin-like phospholipase family protein n=1 Tax=Achromobacter spanius TaxID=217203 RepID=UPI00320864EC
MTEQNRAGAGVGLVLSGGGAKGAYQAGVLSALTESNISVGCLAGASIGALNGAIVSAASSQEDAVRRLQALWEELAQVPPIRFGGRLLKVPAYVAALMSFGLPLRAGAGLAAALRATMMARSVWDKVVDVIPALQVFEGDNDGLVCNKRITSLIDEYLPEGGLPDRLPLHVSVFPTQGAFRDILSIVGSGLGLTDTADSEFMHVQALPVREQKKVLFASAALPLLFTPQRLDGKLYTDGGQGGWRSVQGNTPIQPLLDAGCSHVIVTHLADGSAWERHRFPDASIIEIRPSGISRGNTFSDLLGFDAERIPDWIEQGYEDTLACLGRIRETLDAHTSLSAARGALDASLARTGEADLARAMKRLREG